MIAQLLQPHEHRQYQSATLDAVGLFQLLRNVGDQLFVQHGLLLRQPASDFHFGLVRQIGHDIRISLHPPQNIGTYQFSQSRNTTRVLLFRHLL